MVSSYPGLFTAQGKRGESLCEHHHQGAAAPAGHRTASPLAGPRTTSPPKEYLHALKCTECGAWVSRWADPGPDSICSTSTGWWFDACGPSNLNGMYYPQRQNTNRFNGIKWYYWKGSGYSLKATAMMVRPADF